MQTSSPEPLNPRKLIDYFANLRNQNELDEVTIRRIISAVYFALFNYWSLKSYTRGSRGGGPLGDSLSFSKFHEHRLKQGLDYAVYTIYLYRVAVDHYTLNPTKVALTSKPWRGQAKEVKIDEAALDKVLESAYDILNHLEKN